MYKWNYALSWGSSQWHGIEQYMTPWSDGVPGMLSDANGTDKMFYVVIQVFPSRLFGLVRFSLTSGKPFK